jgi:hypothetical protein
MIWRSTHRNDTRPKSSCSGTVSIIQYHIATNVHCPSRGGAWVRGCAAATGTCLHLRSCTPASTTPSSSFYSIFSFSTSSTPSLALPSSSISALVFFTNTIDPLIRFPTSSATSCRTSITDHQSIPRTSPARAVTRLLQREFSVTRTSSRLRIPLSIPLSIPFFPTTAPSLL